MGCLSQEQSFDIGFDLLEFCLHLVDLLVRPGLTGLKPAIPKMMVTRAPGWSQSKNREGEGVGMAMVMSRTPTIVPTGVPTGEDSGPSPEGPVTD